MANKPLPDLLCFPHTDSGNAERLMSLFQEKIRYCPDFKSWFVWDGKHWSRDPHGPMNRMAKEMARELYAQALSIPEGNDRNRADAKSFARRSENAGGIRATLECARSEIGVSISATSLDCNPWLLNCKNGTLDLK